MTATILLVRHAAHAHLGATLSGRTPGLALSGDGRVQAEALSRFLAGRWDRIETSPVQRARETAAVLAGNDSEPLVIDALDEIDFGDWSGRAFIDLADDPAWTRWNEARGTAAAPGGEAMAAAQARAVEHVRDTAEASVRIAMVTHCDIIRAVVAWVLGLPLDYLLRFDIDPASVTTIEAGDWGSRLVRLNEVAA